MRGPTTSKFMSAPSLQHSEDECIIWNSINCLFARPSQAPRAAASPFHSSGRRQRIIRLTKQLAFQSSGTSEDRTFSPVLHDSSTPHLHRVRFNTPCRTIIAAVSRTTSAAERKAMT